MSFRKRFVIYALSAFPVLGFSQYLSNLKATRNDALFTTYAAPISRSEYKTDHGYQFSWFDNENGVEFISKDGINMGIAFKLGTTLHFRLKELFREPIVTTSYSDLVKYYYYPFENIRVDVFFDVYSSRSAILDITITNEGVFVAELGVFPYLYYPSGDTVNSIFHENLADFYSFQMEKKKDGWMIEHDIPVTEKLSGYITGNLLQDSVSTFTLSNRNPIPVNRIDPFNGLKKSIQQQKKNARATEGIILSRTCRIYPGDKFHFRMVYSLEDISNRIQDVSRKIKSLLTLDLNQLILEDEKTYSRIPVPDSLTRDQEMLHWSCFSLLRQCIMPAEGKCGFNYYVFSREPKWGWGYGGQVFHESLAMMSYAYMDPLSAMNSQRIYFERQHEDGYINYRTGPYLDEMIEYNGRKTSSAPWFSYENLEIYKVTEDSRFLKEAYESGKKFYRFFTANRDSNGNGLCEWGGEASLESVRDARVAVWDQVGWPSNFEGPDVNSMLVMEAKSLAEMAEKLGLPEDSKSWKKEADTRKEMVNKYMWDESTGFYYNVNRNDQTFTYMNQDDLKIKEIIGFLPLWAGISDKNQAELLVKRMTDPEEFWRPFGVPTLSAKESYYNPIGYWNGPVWIQWDYLLFRGLMDYGYKKEARELADKVLDNMIWHLKNDHTFWEFYSPDDRQAGWNKTYIWAGIAARFLIDRD
jgi:hypothetical protein